MQILTKKCIMGTIAVATIFQGVLPMEPIGTLLQGVCKIIITETQIVLKSRWN